MIVFLNDPLVLNNVCILKKRSGIVFYTIVLKTIVIEKTIVFYCFSFIYMLTIINEGLSLMIVNETMNFIRTVVF